MLQQSVGTVLYNGEEGALNCCLHRSLSIANNVTGCRETAQACPKVTGSEAAAEDAAAGGAGGAGDGPIGEGYTVWVGRSSLRSDVISMAAEPKGPLKIPEKAQGPPSSAHGRGG